MSERERELHAYHDGELSVFGRWRVRRWLAGDSAARRDLAWLAEVRALLREQQAEAPAPDLWEAIRAELPSRAPAAVPAQELRSGWSGGWLRWLAPAAAAAVAALALTFGVPWGDAPDGRSVRWLDAGGRAAMVLQDDREATIIWVLDAPDRVSGRTSRAVS